MKTGYYFGYLKKKNGAASRNRIKVISEANVVKIVGRKQWKLPKALMWDAHNYWIDIVEKSDKQVKLLAGLARIKAFVRFWVFACTYGFFKEKEIRIREINDFTPFFSASYLYL